MTRIIKETKCGNTVYKVQKKKWLFWWFTETMHGIEGHGENGEMYDITFDTLEEAQQYICENYSTPTIEII